MNPNEAQITDTTQWGDQKGSNVTFLLESDGFIGNFRIHYVDESRKNAKFSSYIAVNCYFENIDTRPNSYATYHVDKVLNAMLFVERKAQWILETIMKDHDSVVAKEGATITNMI